MDLFKKLGLVSVLIVLTLPGCDSADGVENHAPEILSLVTNPSTIEVPDFTNKVVHVRVNAIATDPDRDALSYVWTASSGILDLTTGNPTTLMLQEYGSVIVTCTVSDGVATDSMSITIEVTQ